MLSIYSTQQIHFVIIIISAPVVYVCMYVLCTCTNSVRFIPLLNSSFEFFYVCIQSCEHVRSRKKNFPKKKLTQALLLVHFHFSSKKLMRECRDIIQTRFHFHYQLHTTFPLFEAAFFLDWLTESSFSLCYSSWIRALHNSLSSNLKSIIIIKCNDSRYRVLFSLLFHT